MTIPILAALLAAAGLSATAATHTVEHVLGRMDTAAAGFRSLTAHARIVKYTAIVKDETADEGTIWVKRVKPRVTHMLLEFTSPDRYFFKLTEKKAQIYRPKIATLEEYDVGQYRKMVDQLWLLSFGAAGRDLASRYRVSVHGEETVAGDITVRLDLVPKSAELLQHITRIEMWISTRLWQPVQQKFYEISPGDYRLYTYTDVKWNPEMPDSRLSLPAPPGTRRVQPGK